MKKTRIQHSEGHGAIARLVEIDFEDSNGRPVSLLIEIERQLVDGPVFEGYDDRDDAARKYLEQLAQRVDPPGDHGWWLVHGAIELPLKKGSWKLSIHGAVIESEEKLRRHVQSLIGEP